MGDAEITTSAWRQVEIGRVVLFNEGEFEGRLAVIVEIIDHKRVRLLCDLGAVQQLTET
jgi:large subunit ribosomal protein L14e